MKIQKWLPQTICGRPVTIHAVGDDATDAQQPAEAHGDGAGDELQHLMQVAAGPCLREERCGGV